MKLKGILIVAALTSALAFPALAGMDVKHSSPGYDEWQNFKRCFHEAAGDLVVMETEDPVGLNGYVIINYARRQCRDAIDLIPYSFYKNRANEMTFSARDIREEMERVKAAEKVEVLLDRFADRLRDRRQATGRK